MEVPMNFQNLNIFFVLILALWRFRAGLGYFSNEPEATIFVFFGIARDRSA